MSNAMSIIESIYIGDTKQISCLHSTKSFKSLTKISNNAHIKATETYELYF